MHLSALSKNFAATGEEPKKQSRISEAAAQFESLMIGQLLEPLTKTDGDSPSSSSVLDMGKDQLAQAITAGGGIGLRQTILRSLGST